MTTPRLSPIARIPRWLGLLWAVLPVLGVTPDALAQRGLTEIPDPDPEVEHRALKTDPRFRIELFAAEPLVRKPINMNWDERGRLWVASSTVYPHIKPGQEANDRIYVLEDTDGDGKADKSTVFAESLLIPTLIIPGHGGAYVGNSTELLFLKDTNGDGRADLRRIVLSGFGTEDTHHIIHTPRWGPDGRLYFNQSIYIHSHVETPFGPRRLAGGGVWRFQTDSSRLEVFCRGLVNPWGHAFDRWGQSFLTDGAGSQGIHYAFPDVAFFTAVGVTRTMPGLNPGQPKQCGLEFLSGRHIPAELRGHLVTCDFRGNRINRFALADSGAGYISTQQSDLVWTDHVAFRPVDVKMGPDGALYIADWYNPIIQHGEVDFRDPRRDHEHGRIWRLTAIGRPTLPKRPWDAASTAELLAALTAPEQWTRDQARRLLSERGPEAVVPQLAAWLRDIAPDDPDREHHRLEALWLYQAWDRPNWDLLEQVLKSERGQARAAAVRVLRDWADRHPDPLSILRRTIGDAYPRVRLETLHVLRRVHTADAAALALSVLEHPMDDFLDYALWFTIRDLADVWQPAIARKPDLFGDDVGRWLYVLSAVPDPTLTALLADHFRNGRVPKSHERAAIERLALLGGPAELTLIFERVLTGDTPPDVLRALERRPVNPAPLIEHLRRLLAGPPEQRIAAVRLAGSWNVTALLDDLRALAANPEAPAGVRRAAVAAIGRLKGDAARRTLESLSEPPHPLRLRLWAASALAAHDVNSAADRFVEVCAQIRVVATEDQAEGTEDAVPQAEVAEAFTAFLQRKGGVAALTRALQDRRIPAAVANIGIRQLSGVKGNTRSLTAALEKAGRLQPIRAELTPRELRRLAFEVRRYGNPARGEMIFRREKLACLKCHAIAGAGGQVGPDLLSIGASAPVDYIIESLLNPSKKIKEGYHTTTIATTDGQVINGRVIRKTDTEVVLRDQNDNEIRVPRDQIEAEQVNPKSLMPDRLTADLTHDEFIDLVAFLSSLGKSGSGFVVPNERYVRRWEYCDHNAAVNDAIRHHGPDYPARPDAKLPWRPVYAKVNGELPLQGIPFQGNIGGRHYQYLRFAVRVIQPGPFKLVFNDPTGLRIWVGTREVPAAEEVQLDLPRGTHTVTIASESRLRNMKPLRVEVRHIRGSSGQVEPVSGK
ncbi:MAG: sorbosone dehydrogenase [Planctomycetota bacterium]|nr:MAG: sorbosone dehydrogenase [Planctomycetota bacterium]